MNRFIGNMRPRLLLAYADSAYASRCVRYFRRLGWEVRMAASGNDARKQIAEFHPTFFVIDADMPDESGWLTCAKILLDRPELNVAVQVRERDDEAVGFQRFLGLDRLIVREDGVEGLADLVLGKAFAQVRA